MSWIQTFTGRKVNPLNMREADVDGKDIAHALALKCRYTGHCPYFYSVAQHSVLVAQRCSQENALWGLLHDAPEAYFADISRPVKIGLRERFGAAFDEIERSIMNAVCEKFGLPLEEPFEIKMADNLLLTTEAKGFFGSTKTYQDWHHRPENGFAILKPAIIVCWPWEEAEKAFLAALAEMGCFQ